MARKKKESEAEMKSDEGMDEPLTSELIEPEKPLEEVSEKIESDYEKHPKFSKFKGDGK